MYHVFIYICIYSVSDSVCIWMVVKGDADAALVVLQTWCQYAIDSHGLTKHVENLQHVSSRSI